MSKNKKITNYVTAIGILILLAVFLFYLYSHNPSNKENFYASCTFKSVTGLDCPGCGGQRSVHHLLHFDIVQAFRFNAFFVLALPYILLLIFHEVRLFFWKIPKPKNFLTSNKMLWIFVVAILLFGLIRNLPYYPFTLLATPN
ncbi:MAG: DUF2752 domain-containing protein [Moheibacter sp.]